MGNQPSVSDNFSSNSGFQNNSSFNNNSFGLNSRINYSTSSNDWMFNKNNNTNNNLNINLNNNLNNNTNSINFSLNKNISNNADNNFSLNNQNINLIPNNDSIFNKKNNYDFGLNKNNLNFNENNNIKKSAFTKIDIKTDKNKNNTEVVQTTKTELNNINNINNTNSGLKPYIDVDKKTPALHASDANGSARITTDGVRIINNVDDNNRIVSSVNKNNVSIGSGVKDELKTTNYEVGVDTTLSRDSELYVKRTDIYKNDTNNDKIARVKLNESRVPLEMPICGEVGSVRTTTTIEGDTTIQEVRDGINAPGAACIAAVGVGATVGASELLVATEGASALAVAGTTMALSTTVTE